MREIKFRAWDGIRTYNVEKLVVGDVSYPDEVAGYNIWGKDKFSMILMQYTGLKDKNGKEIYEGDVVTFHAFVFKGSETEYESKGIIKYRPDGMCFVIEEKNDFDWMVRDTSQFGEACFEIIGNIYENPELLDNNKTNE